MSCEGGRLEKSWPDSQTGIEMEEDPNRLPAAVRTKTTALGNGIAAPLARLSLPHQGLRRRPTRRPRARQQKTDIAPHAGLAICFKCLKYLSHAEAIHVELLLRAVIHTFIR